MKYLIILLFFFSFSVHGSPKKINCKVHRIFCAMKDLNPNLDNKYAMKMSNLIYKYSKVYELPPLLSVAIFMQESSMGTFKHRKQKVLVKTKNCIEEQLSNDYCSERYEVVEGTADAGIWQFSVETIVRNKMDISRVISDPEYTTKWHFKILKSKIKMCKKKYPTTSWACYNSATPHHHHRYVQLVMRWFSVIRER